MRIKYILLVVLAVACFGLLSGCGSKEEPTEAVTEAATEATTEAAKEDYKDKITEGVIRQSLGIPDKADIEIQYSEPYFWDGGGKDLVTVYVTGKGDDEGYVAGADFTLDGECCKSVLSWTKE